MGVFARVKVWGLYRMGIRETNGPSFHGAGWKGGDRSSRAKSLPGW